MLWDLSAMLWVFCYDIQWKNDYAERIFEKEPNMSHDYGNATLTIAFWDKCPFYHWINSIYDVISYFKGKCSWCMLLSDNLMKLFLFYQNIIGLSGLILFNIDCYFFQ